MGNGAVGDFTWHELSTSDPDAALRFYSELFGWGKGAAHDMGAMGTYQLITIAGKDVGGIYKPLDHSTPPSWLSYVRVPDAAKAASATKAAGGRVLHGPVEVPGGSWVVMGLDPQGGAFAVVEPPKQAKAASSPPAQKPAAKPASAPAQSAVKPRTTTSAAKPATAAKTAPKKKAAAKKLAKSAAKKTRASGPAKKRPAAKKGAKKAAKKVAKKTRAATKRVVAKNARGKGKAKAKGKKRR
jgi:predicted enzyme related to lactoylglutathione lyase